MDHRVDLVVVGSHIRRAVGAPIPAGSARMTA
jgi:hypothetical protein